MPNPKFTFQLEKDLLRVIDGTMSKMFFAEKYKGKLCRPYKTVCDFEYTVQMALYKVEKNVR